jgi:hypothetical protein
MPESTAMLKQRAKRALTLGMRVSGQGTYARRAPKKDSISHFDKSRSLLLAILKNDPLDQDALLMMSQLEECLLNYPKAIEYLKKAFEAGKKCTNKDLKRLTLLRSNLVEWRDLSLTPNELRELGRYLELHCPDVSERSFPLTREWMLLNGIGDPDSIIAGLERRGAFSDFQVLANIVNG